MQTSSPMRRLLVACAGLVFITISQAALSAQLAEDYKVSYRYNAMGQVTGVIQPDPDGPAGPRRFIATRNTYDGRGLLVMTERGSMPAYQDETVDPQQWLGFDVYRQQIYGYDQLGRRTTSSVADPQGNEVSLTQTSYDSEHNVRCSTVRMNPAAYSSLPSDACALGTQGNYGPDRITRFSYDASGWGAVTLEERAVGTPLEQDYKTYEYDSHRLLTSTTDANGNYTHYDYDSLSRLYRMYFPSKTTAGVHSTTDYEQYTYDENNNLTVLRKRDGRIIVYTYDKLNRITRKYFPIGGGTLVYYGYDLRGLQTYARFLATTGEGITNTYDGFGSVATSTNNMGGISRTLSYRYDADSNRIRVAHPDNKFFTYEFDGLSRLTNIREQGSYSLSETVYSDDGRPDLVNRSGGNVVTDFEFDAVLRPDEFGHDFAATANDVDFSYTYQPSHQIASRTISNDKYVYDEHSIGSEAYQVNGLNQYTTVDGNIYTYDDNGNLTSDGSTTYSYDIENRLISTTGGSIATLKYDPNGRLYEVTGGGNTTRFLFDDDQLVAEYSTAGTMRKRYVHGAGIDDPIVEYNGATVASSTRKHLFKDHLGSVVATTNNAGAVVDSNSFDSYGIPAAGNVGRFGFTGQMYIAEVGLNYYKARMYSPKLGRFLQTDPVGYDDGMNIYAYVGNDPMNNFDPNGTFALGLLAKVVKVAIKGGDIASTVAGAVEDFKTLTDSSASVGERMIAAASLVSEVVSPVSARDVKAAGNAVSAGRKTCCFVAGTLVDTDDGLKPIEDIEVGDLVWARDVESGETMLKPVTDLIRRHERRIWVVELESEDGSRSRFETTDDHPWWIPETGWIDTSDLAVGMVATTKNGQNVTVTVVEESERSDATYNLTVADFETYFVGEKRVLVHNCDLPRNADGTFASGAGGDSASAARGREAHAEWDAGEGFEKEVTLPSGKRADAVNFDEQHVKELKPNNPRAQQRGERQVERYRQELQDTCGGNWTSSVECYDP